MLVEGGNSSYNPTLVSVEDNFQKNGFLKNIVWSVVLAITLLVVVFLLYSVSSFEEFISQGSTIGVYSVLVLVFYIYFSHISRTHLVNVSKTFFDNFMYLKTFTEKKFNFSANNIFFISGKFFIYISDDIVDIYYLNSLKSAKELKEYILGDDCSMDPSSLVSMSDDSFICFPTLSSIELNNYFYLMLIFKFRFDLRTAINDLLLNSEFVEHDDNDVLICSEGKSFEMYGNRFLLYATLAWLFFIL